MRSVLVLVALAAVALVDVRADACSCMGPASVIVSPDRLDDAPINTKIRLELAMRYGSSKLPRAFVRAVATGEEVRATSRSIAIGTTLVELTPASLAPSTQYEVGVVDETQHPKTIILGTFKTGTATDTTAPRIEKPGAAAAHIMGMAGTSCSVPGPWIDIDGLTASDPSRPNAQLAYGVWRASPNGAIDSKRTPDAILPAPRGALTLGHRYACDPHDFAVPKSGTFAFGVAALDEAGNASAVQKYSVNMSAAAPRTTP